MSEPSTYAPDYLRAQDDKQLHAIADMCEKQIEKITQLQSDLKTAHEMIREFREALELYADERNWRQTEEADGWLYNERFDPGWTDPERFKSGNFSNKDLEDGDGTYSSCGKRARAVLEKWQGKLNGL